MNEPIDAVITWVDGDDPVLRRKRESYMKGNAVLQRNDIGGETRYRSLGEIDWCVFSILKYAPFIRNIYIVTDNQNPHPERITERYFPGSENKIKIIDHKEIFKGYEQYLPTFNSLSIETMLWRIPGLSERFIYFNDDIILWNPVKPEDFFVDDKIVVYGYGHLTFTGALCLWKNKLLRNHKVKFRDSMVRSSRLVYGHYFGKFIRHQHTPLAQCKSINTEFYNSHPGVLEGNIKHRFRSTTQYHPMSLQFTYKMRQGKMELQPYKGKLLYLNPSADNARHTLNSLNTIREGKDELFCCINTFDQADEATRNELKDIINRHLGIDTDSLPEREKSEREK